MSASAITCRCSTPPPDRNTPTAQAAFDHWHVTVALDLDTAEAARMWQRAGIDLAWPQLLDTLAWQDADRAEALAARLGTTWTIDPAALLIHRTRTATARLKQNVLGPSHSPSRIHLAQLSY